jgi:hypothetical protein
MATERTFWLVWSPINPRSPSRRYPSRSGAHRAARAMAAKFAADKSEFYVLKAQSYHRFYKRSVRDIILAAWGVGSPPKMASLISRSISWVKSLTAA